MLISCRVCTRFHGSNLLTPFLAVLWHGFYLAHICQAMFDVLCNCSSPAGIDFVQYLSDDIRIIEAVVMDDI